VNTSFFRKSFVAKANGPITLRNDEGKLRLVSITGEANGVKAKEVVILRSEKDEQGKRKLGPVMPRLGFAETTILEKVVGRVGDAKENDGALPAVAADEVAVRLTCHLFKSFANGWLIGQEQADGYAQSMVIYWVAKKALIEAASKTYGFDVTLPGTHIHLWGVKQGSAGTIVFADDKSIIGMKAVQKSARTGVEQTQKPEREVTGAAVVALNKGRIATL